jgi:hypothetical protein
MAGNPAGTGQMRCNVCCKGTGETGGKVDLGRCRRAVQSRVGFCTAQRLGRKACLTFSAACLRLAIYTLSPAPIIDKDKVYLDHNVSVSMICPQTYALQQCSFPAPSPRPGVTIRVRNQRRAITADLGL